MAPYEVSLLFLCISLMPEPFLYPGMHAVGLIMKDLSLETFNSIFIRPGENPSKTPFVQPYPRHFIN